MLIRWELYTILVILNILKNRTELFASAGFDITSIEQEGITFQLFLAIVISKKGAQFEQEILIKTWIDERPNTLRINYEAILKGSTSLIASGYTIHAFIGINGKPKDLQNLAII